MTFPMGGGPDGTGKSVVLGAIWRARWVILTAMVVAGVGGYFLSVSQPATYTASGRIVLSSTQNFDPLGSQGGGDPTRYVANQINIIYTQPILAIAAESMDGTVTVGELAESLEVTASTGNDVITVAASGPTATAAADRANAVVTAYREYVGNRVRDAAAAAAGATSDPNVADRIRTLAAVYGDGVAVSELAPVPVEPSAPKPLRDAGLLAALAGLVAAGVAVWRRGPSGEATLLSAAAQARVLGIVPVHPVRRGRRPAADPNAHALALVALDYARQGAAGPVLITGAGWNSGAPSVAYGIAVSAALDGRRVLIVDAEPGSRELVLRSGGLSPARSVEALAGGAPEEDVLVPVPMAGPGAPNLMLATLGVSDGAGPLDADAVRKSLMRLEGTYDLTIVQVGPVSESPVAFALVRQAEVIVAAVGMREDPDVLTALRDRLETAQRRLTGVVMTRAVRSAGRDPAAARVVQPANEAGPAPAPEFIAARR